MYGLLINLASLLLAVVLLEVGSGLQGLLIPVRADIAGFATTLIGGLGTAYYLGFVVGCLQTPHLVHRVGHIRCFAALAAVGACVVLTHGLIVDPWIWIGLRLLMGYCFAGLYMVVESWLNERAGSETRGRILALYMIATWAGVVGGKLLFPLAPADGFVLFALACMLIALSLVPVALTAAVAPVLPALSRAGIADVYRTAPIGLVGCAAIGLANGAFWSLAPVFALARGGSSIDVGLFMAAAVVGGGLSQWPLGRWSDRVDRRWVIFGSCVAAAVVGGLLLVERDGDGITMLALAAAFGASALPIYSLCVAHANDRASPEAFVEVSGRLLLAFGVGAIFGPLVAGVAITWAGPASLFVYMGVIHISLAAFIFVRLRLVEAVPEAERGSFAPMQPVPHTTQVVFELHPASEAAGEPEQKAD